MTTTTNTIRKFSRLNRPRRRARSLHRQQTEDDDDHEHDQENSRVLIVLLVVVVVLVFFTSGRPRTTTTTSGLPWGIPLLLQGGSGRTHVALACDVTPLNQSVESITIRASIGIRQKMANARIRILFGQRETIK
jgi:hypothetical protein